MPHPISWLPTHKVLTSQVRSYWVKSMGYCVMNAHCQYVLLALHPVGVQVGVDRQKKDEGTPLLQDEPDGQLPASARGTKKRRPLHA